MKEVATSLKDLSHRQRRLLRDVGRDLERAVSAAEARSMLEARAGGPALANPLLRPVAFAVRQADRKSHAHGLAQKAVALGLFLPTAAVLLAAVIGLLLLVARDLYHFRAGIATELVSLGALGVLAKWLTLAECRMERGLWTARRLSRNAYEKLCADTRPPILYLRSFSFDPAYQLPSETVKRVDEILADHYEKFGPVIAVAGPYDKDFSAGPVRLHFSDEVWRAAAVYLMSVSQLVVIQAGISPGTLWELAVARGMLEPEGVVISVADASPHHYRDFRPYAEAIIGCELPKDVQASKQISFGRGWIPGG